MTISIIVARGENGVIGKKNQLPWRLPADMHHFKEVTLGKTVIMGQNTYESIGRPLPKRKNIVLTTNKDYLAEGIVVAHSVEEALRKAENSEEIMIIGGASIYKQFLEFSDKIYLTIIHKEFEGDTFFPTINEKEWDETNRVKHHKDEKNEYDYTFVTLQRKKQ